MESFSSSTRRLWHRGAEHRPMTCAPQREFFFERSQGSKNSAGRKDWKVCVPRLTRRRKEKAMKEAQLRSRSDGTKPNLIR